MFLYYQIMHLLGLFNTAGYACLCYEKYDVYSVSKVPHIITIYGADIEIKYSQVTQSSLKHCYHVNKEFLVECITLPMFKLKSGMEERSFQPLCVQPFKPLTINCYAIYKQIVNTWSHNKPSR